MKSSSPITSSFFCSSPVVLDVPSRPVSCSDQLLDSVNHVVMRLRTLIKVALRM
jgi:hypothetical protein